MKHLIRKTAVLSVYGIFFAAMMAMGVSNYNECREHGFSVLYCVVRK